MEWAEVYGQLYGTPWSELEPETGSQSDLLLDIDVQGGTASDEIAVAGCEHLHPSPFVRSPQKPVDAAGNRFGRGAGTSLSTIPG